jgi:hypothetical protein
VLMVAVWARVVAAKAKRSAEAATAVKTDLKEVCFMGGVSVFRVLE